MSISNSSFSRQRKKDEERKHYRYNEGSSGSFSRRSTEDAYYGSDAWLEQRFYNSGLDDSYYEQWMSNPHWQEYRYYSEAGGIGEDLSQALTGSSANQRNAIQAKTDALTYEAQLLDKYRSNVYDSDVSVVGRMNQAGLNSNLLGTSGAAEDGGLGNIADTFAAEPSVSDLDVASGAVNPILEIAQTYLSLRTGFANLKHVSLSNENLASSTLGSIVDFARGAALDSIQPSDFDSYKADKEGFLDGVLKNSQQLAKNYFGEDYPQYKTARKVFQSAFNQHRSSVFANYKSWDEYNKMRGSQLSSSLIEHDVENGISMAMLNLQSVRTEIDAFYSDLEAKLIRADGFDELVQEKMFSGIVSDIQKNYAASAEASYQADLWNKMDSSGVYNQQSAAMRNEFIARAKEAIAAQKIADIKQADAVIVSQFNDYLRSHSMARTNSFYDTGSARRHDYEQSFKRLYGNDPFVEYHPLTWSEIKELMSLGVIHKK